MNKYIGKNDISVKVIKDSISPNNARLTTFELEYHRYILGEVNTHRALSKSSASSRAVPLKKAMEHVKNKPAIPVHWGKAQSGMQASEELEGVNLERAKLLWQKGIEQSLDLVEEFDKLGVHKQIAGRWLETGQMIKSVITGTDWANLVWLRNDETAQPEFHELARLIELALEVSIPQLLHVGEYHLPYIDTYRDKNDKLVYIDSNDETLPIELAREISASCCAQVSYRNLNDSPEKALDIYKKLFSGTKKHMSPTEHVGTPICTTSDTNIPFDPQSWELGITHVSRQGTLHSGNLSGWIQFRQTLPDNVYL